MALVPTAVAAGSRALIIGIDEYAVDPNVTRLAGAVNDAKAVHALALGDLGFDPSEVRVLTNREASREGILRSIDEWLVAGTRPGDRVLFYYAGHGAQQRSSGPDTEQGFDQTLVPVDTVVRNGRVLNMITDKELKARFARLAGRQVTVIVDACHSGTITRSAAGGLPPQSIARTPYGLMPYLGATAAPSTRSVPRGRADLFPRQDGLVVWSAVTAFQVALEENSAGEPRGVFTRAFIEGLTASRADRDRDGDVSHAELLDWVQARSSAHCRSAPASCTAGLLPTLEAPSSLFATSVRARLMGMPVEARRIEAQALVSAVIPEAASTLTPSARPALVWVEQDRENQQAGWSARDGRPPVFRLGETMALQFTSPIDGHLTLFNVEPGGRLIQIFPNPRSAAMAGGGAERRVQSGRRFVIPVGQLHGFELKAGEPLGDGMAVAVVTDQPLDLSAIAPATRGARPVADDGEVADYIETIAALLREPHTLGDVDQQVGWAIATAPYRTTR